MNNNLLQRLDECVAKELDAGSRLLESLHEENAALSSRDAGRIEEAVGTKSRTLSEFQQLDREREQLMCEAGHPAGRQDISDSVPNSDSTRRKRLLDNWMKLLELAGECQRQNNVNGALIQSGLRHTRQALSLLSGQPPGETPQYGPASQAAHSTNRHSLGKV